MDGVISLGSWFVVCCGAQGWLARDKWFDIFFVGVHGSLGDCWANQVSASNLPVGLPVEEDGVARFSISSEIKALTLCREGSAYMKARFF